VWPSSIFFIFFWCLSSDFFSFLLCLLSFSLSSLCALAWPGLACLSVCLSLTHLHSLALDENDIDYLIGDLLKEEAQLVLTRILRLPDLEAEIRKAIEIVRHSRTKFTEQQIKQQLVQFEQLRMLQQAAAASGGFNFDFGAGQGGGFGGFGGGAGAGKPGLDPTILKSIRSKVGASFKKRTGPRGVEMFTVEEAIIQGELSNAMEKSDNGLLRAALDILQAITEEFVERSGHVGEANVDNFAPLLERIGKSWIEVFLGGSIEGDSELSADERDTWAEKLRSWNKSPEEESILNAARWAGKLGWQDAKLRQVLQGEFTPGEKVEFKEPKRLSQERLLVLERSKQLTQALNLARGLELNQQVARFLMKMNQPKEAVEAGLKLKVASEVYSLAQVARPVDLESAFTLGVYCLSLQDQSRLAEANGWLCDLAIAENKLDDLIQRVAAVVKSKNTQLQVINTLRAKKSPRSALALGYKTLKPYTPDELLALWRELNPEPANPTALDEIKIVPATRGGLLASVPGSAVPANLGHLLWETAFEVDQEAALAGGPASNLADEALGVDMQLIDSVQQLHNLMTTLEARKQGPQVQLLGKNILEKVISQEKVDLDYRRENTIARIKHEQERVAAEARGEVVPPFVSRPVDHPQYTFEDFKGQVCRLMLQSTLTTKATLQSLADPQLAAAAKITEAERLAKIAECDRQLAEIADLAIGKIQNPADLIQLAKAMVQQAEFRLALKIDQKAFAQVQALDKEREPREATAQEYAQLRGENDVLQSQRLALAPEKAERLRELYTQVELNALLPKFARGTVKEYAQLYQQIASLNIETAISSQTALVLTQRLTPQEISDIIDHSLGFVRNPQNVVSVVQYCRNFNEFRLVQKVGRLALEKIAELRQRLVQRLFIETELNQLQTEQAILRSLKKELEQDQATRLEELQENLRAFAPFFYELATCDAYDKLQSSTLENMMTSGVQEVKHLDGLIRTFPPETPAEKIAKTREDLVAAEKAVPVIYEECVALIVSPAHALQFARSLESAGQTELCVKTCEHGHSLVPALSYQAMQRWDVKRDLKELTDEQNELANQRPLPQQLTPEKAQKLRGLQLQVALWDTESSFQNDSPVKLESQILELASTMQRGLQAVHRQRLASLENIGRQLLQPAPVLGTPGVSDATIAAHEAAVRTLNEEKARITEELPRLVQQKRRAVDHCVAVITTNPRHLQDFTQSLELLDPESVDLILTAARQVFLVTEKMNEERIAHSPTLEKIELLSEEAELLEKYRKKLSDAQAAEYLALGREDDRWNFTCTRLKALDLNDLKRDLAQHTLGLFQQQRAQHERTLRDLLAQDPLKQAPVPLRTPNTDPAHLEAFIRKIQDATELFLGEALQFVKSPYDTNQLCGQFPDHIPHLRRLVRTGFDNTAELNALYEERSPLYAELRKLQGANDELQAANKQLKKQDQDRLTELRHQRFVWDQEYPYRRVRPETREGFKYKMLSSLEQAIVRRKTEIRSSLEVAEEEQKTREAQGLMQVDGQEDLLAKIQKLRADLAEVDRTMEANVREFAQELNDPKHYLDLTTQLLSDGEAALVLQIGKLGHTLMLKIDAERQKHAEIYRSYFLLQGEVYTEKNKNTFPHATRQEKLKEVEAQVATIVPIKYGAIGPSTHYSSGGGGGGGFGGGRTKGGRGAAAAAAGGASHNSAASYPTPEDLAKAAQLTESKDVKFNDPPTDWSVALNNNHLETLIGQVAVQMLTAVTTEKDRFLEELAELEQSGLRDPEKGDTPEIKARREALEKKLREITTYTMNTVRDFNNSQKLFSHVQAKQENALLLILGEKILDQIQFCRQAASANEEPVREMQKLEAEQSKLQSQRSSLAEPEQLRLLQLQFQQNLRTVTPSYLQLNMADYHRVVNATSNTMLDVVYYSKQAREKSINDSFNAPRLVRGASLTEDQMREKTQKELVSFEEDIDRVLKLVCKFVAELDHIQQITRKFNAQFKDFKRLLILGARAQELLKAQLEIQDKYDTLLKKKQELEEKQIAGAPVSLLSSLSLSLSLSLFRVRMLTQLPPSSSTFSAL